MSILSESILSDDTIVAIATPPGRGALAIIRVSGPDAHTIAASRISPWPVPSRQAVLAAVRDNNGELIDRALVTAFHGPASFTGEDTVEITTHGGAVVPALVVSSFVAAGARPARPGEFTQRAVLHGKVNLVEAEAIGDLIDARSRAMHKAAVHQLSGNLTRRITELREEIIHLQALIAYDIDFPEEDDGPIDRARISKAVTHVLGGLDALLATAHTGELIREGAIVVIAGPPNAGKSSLFNALLGTERAIVTDIPGTTRDAIEAVLDTGTWPLRLVDTAGLRETADTVELLGIEISTRYLGSADVVLACGDSDTAVTDTANTVASLTEATVIPVRTKVDKYDTAAYQNGGSSSSIAVSAQTGSGLPQLLSVIESALSTRLGAPELDAPVITRERQRFALQTARAELATFASVWDSDEIPAPVAATMLNSATHALEEVIGAVDVEDVFDKLFQTFCVGK